VALYNNPILRQTIPINTNNTVMHLAKVTAVTRPAVGRCKGVKLKPHISPLMVGVNRGVLSNGAHKLQGGEVDSMAIGLVESCPMLPHQLSGRQGCEIHNKLDLHTSH
jgi:hypothetical protein